RRDVADTATVTATVTAMSDGHLYLSAHGGIDYAGDSRTSWYDAAHQSIHVLSPRSRKLRQIQLNTRLQPTTTATDADTAIATTTATTAATATAVKTMPSSHDADSSSSSRSSSESESGSSGDDDEEEDDEDDASSEALVQVLYDFDQHVPIRAARASAAASSVTLEQPIALVRLSLDKQFVALQKSDVEVQVINVHTRMAFWIVCKPKAGNRLLTDGVVWNVHSHAPGSSQDLFLVTKMGIEQYRVSAKRRQCTLHRVIGVYIHNFWYSATHGVLMVSTGSRANELVPYLLCGANVEKLPRLVFSTAISKNDLYLAPLYGHLYAVYGDVRSAKLLLYLITHTKVSCVRSLHLLLPPGTAIEYSVVDNLLVCHSLDFNVSLFFDVRCDGNVGDPFSSPLPISLSPPARRQPHRVKRKHVDRGHVREHAVAAADVDLIAAFEQLDRSSSLPRPSSQHAIRRADSTNYEMADADEPVPTPAPTDEDATKLTRGPSVGKMDHHQFESTSGEYLTSWRFLPPNLVQRAMSMKNQRDLIEHVELRKLQLNLREIAKSAARHKELIPFLLRRGDEALAKALVLQTIRELLLEQVSVTAAVALFAAAQTASQHDSLLDASSEESSNDTSSDDESLLRVRSSSMRQAFTPRVMPASLRRRFFSDSTVKTPLSMNSRPSRNANGMVLVFQADFYRAVWKHLLQASSVRPTCLGDSVTSSLMIVIATDGLLSVYIGEYMKELRRSFVPIDTVTYLALAEALVAAKKTDDLCQFLHYHILADSIELGRFLFSCGSECPHLRQIAMDMYMRLGAIDVLVLALLEQGEVDQAISVSWKHLDVPGFNSTAIPAAKFFDALMVSVSRRAHSSVDITRRLGSLLLFIRCWDPASLAVKQSTGVSPLAASAQHPFPTLQIPEDMHRKLRAAFGFSDR
ncbi:TPA: hypothetical protein N0F65_004083, partial [Lagenidium giganteum]